MSKTVSEGYKIIVCCQNNHSGIEPAVENESAWEYLWCFQTRWHDSLKIQLYAAYNCNFRNHVNIHL